LKDEVLQKALESDGTVIPRYDIVLPDGTKVAENVQLVLKNVVLTAGTPLNRQTLLKDATATLYGMNIASATPDTVFDTIRRTTSYCPKLKITGSYGATVYVRNVSSNMQSSYTIPYGGVLDVDIMYYSTYKIWSEHNGVRTPDKFIDIDTTKTYTVNVGSFITYCKITVVDEVGATIQAKHTDGTTVRGMVGADKTCTLALYKTGKWSIWGRLEECDSNTVTIEATDAMKGTTTDKTLLWTKVKVDIDSGSTVTLTKDGNSRSGVSIEQTCTILLPSAGTWSVKATLGDKVATNTAYPQLYETLIMSMRYA
jgi:hypothetical protein